MIELLRRVIPAKVLDVITPYEKYNEADLTALAELSYRYSNIIYVCAEVMEAHKLIHNYYKFRSGVDSGDCWNIASICAHFVRHFQGSIPHLFTFRGEFVYHAECAECNGDLYRYWHVTPYNQIGHFTFSHTGWMSFSLYEFVWRLQYMMYYGKEMKLNFRYHGSVEDGYDVRNRLRHIYSDYPNIVTMVNLEQVWQELRAGNYEIGDW